MRTEVRGVREDVERASTRRAPGIVLGGEIRASIVELLGGGAPSRVDVFVQRAQVLEQRERGLNLASRSNVTNGIVTFAFIQIRRVRVIFVSVHEYMRFVGVFDERFTAQIHAEDVFIDIPHAVVANRKFIDAWRVLGFRTVEMRERNFEELREWLVHVVDCRRHLKKYVLTLTRIALLAIVPQISSQIIPIDANFVVTRAIRFDVTRDTETVSQKQL